MMTNETLRAFDKVALSTNTTEALRLEIARVEALLRDSNKNVRGRRSYLARLQRALDAKEER